MITIQYKLNEDAVILVDKLLDLFFDCNSTFMMREIISRIIPEINLYVFDKVCSEKKSPEKSRL